MLICDQKHYFNNTIFRGVDVADGAMRLCAINLYLHGIAGDDSLIETNDSLIVDRNERFDLVLTNPPFGGKSNITYQQEDFWAKTSNKQLNFLQHVKTLLKTNGKAAVVVADNVLFERGAGETIRKKLLQECDLHTLLRLPTGIFYDAQGVKANVLFFDRKPDSQNPWTKKLWIYDFRTNQHFTLKTNPFQLEDLQDFIQCFNPENRHDRQETERFRAFTYEELTQRDKVSLDIFWLNNDSLEKTNKLQTQDVSSAETTNKSEPETLNSTVPVIQLLDILKPLNRMLNPEEEVDKCINQIRQKLKESLKKVTDASDSGTKGSTLEDFTQELFGCFYYLEFYKKNFKNATGEIDVIFMVNKVTGTLFAEFSNLLIVECKNWNKPVGAKEIRIFSDKMDDCGSNIGLIISKNGITGDIDYTKDARGVIGKAWSKSKRVIIVFDLDDLESVIYRNCKLYKILKEKYLSVQLGSDF